MAKGTGKKKAPRKKAAASTKVAAAKPVKKKKPAKKIPSKKTSISGKSAKAQSKKTVSKKKKPVKKNAPTKASVSKPAKKKPVRKKAGEAASPPKKKPTKKKPAQEKAGEAASPPDDKVKDTVQRGVCPVLESGLEESEIGLDLVRIGPPRKWDERKEFIDAVNAWIAKRKKRMAWKFEKKQGLVKQPDPRPLHIASLCNHLGITTRTFLRWREDEEHPLYGICQQVMVAIEADLWDQDGGMAKLNLQSNFGHRSKADITTDGSALPNQAPLSIDPSKLSTAELKQYMKIVRKGQAIDSEK